MNNAKMWLVVKPTVGVPLFLTAVAVGSFAVHVAVLSNTTWVADFLSGKPIGGMASLVPEDQTTAKVAYLTPGSKDIMVVMPDGTVAHAILTDGAVSTLN
ncbi:light-harvesting protein [Tabrizicola sp.]|jgi:light-harvesting protein B-800-850 alpha chain|uniref:light-harvesting protein n=1 Tax=Tabrizicola sp. TaxID=2005166 RepID=UPI00286C2CFF|nr:light-harvesting protein [Tabrizicola sp.]